MKILLLKKYWSLISLLGSALAVVIMVWYLTATGGETQKKGLVTYVDGSVKKQSTVAPDWTKAEKNTPVVTGDKVRTYRESRAELELMELDVLRMAPQTTIDIVQLYEETREKRREVKIQLNQGDIWAKVSKKSGETKFDISTPLNVAAITGTTLRLSFDSDSTTQLKVYKGTVNITNAPEDAKLEPKTIEPYEVPGPHEVQGPHEVSMEQWFYIVKSMQQLTVDKNGQVVSKGSFSTNDVDEKTNWVKWNLQRDRVPK